MNAGNWVFCSTSRESWTRRKAGTIAPREIFEEIQDVGRTARTYGQLAMTAEDRDDIAGALTWAARTYQLASEYSLPVISQSRVHLGRLRDKHGSVPFTDWWRDFTGEEPPDLDGEEEVVL